MENNAHVEAKQIMNINDVPQHYIKITIGKELVVISVGQKNFLKIQELTSVNKKGLGNPKS